MDCGVHAFVVEVIDGRDVLKPIPDTSSSSVKSVFLDYLLGEPLGSVLLASCFALMSVKVGDNVVLSCIVEAGAPTCNVGAH